MEDAHLVRSEARGGGVPRLERQQRLRLSSGFNGFYVSGSSGMFQKPCFIRFIRKWSEFAPKCGIILCAFQQPEQIWFKATSCLGWNHPCIGGISFTCHRWSLVSTKWIGLRISFQILGRLFARTEGILKWIWRLSGASNHKPIVLLSLCSDVSFFGVATPV